VGVLLRRIQSACHTHAFKEEYSQFGERLPTRLVAVGQLAMYMRPLDLDNLLSETVSDLHVSEGPKDL